MYEIDTDSVEFAFEHLRNIAHIHGEGGSSNSEIADALKLVHQGLGMTEEAVDDCFLRVAKFTPGLDKASWMVLGVIVGLAAAQHGSENDPEPE